MKLIVDRIEENIVVCENENQEMIEIDVSNFLEIPKDGDIVKLNDDGMYEILKDETEDRKEEIEDLFSSLFKD